MWSLSVATYWTRFIRTIGIAPATTKIGLPKPSSCHYDKRAVLHVENRLGSEARLSNLTHSCEDKPHQVLGGAKKHHIVPGSPLSLILKNAQKYESREV